MEPSSEENKLSPYQITTQKPQILLNSPPQLALNSPTEFVSPQLKENNVNVIYDQAIIERKLVSFENLKKWDNKRSHLLHMHAKFTETLIGRLELKLDYSNTFMHKIVKFFKEKVNQENEYASSFKERLPRFDKLFNENNENSGLFKSFSEIDELHVKKAQALDTYVNYLEGTILKEILSRENNEFKQRVSAIKDRLQEIRKNLSRINVETAEKSTKYSKAYYEMTEPQSASKSSKKSPKDLYNLELAFLKIAEEQSLLQRELGIEAVAFWKELIRLEVNRMRTIQKVMLNYLIQSENLKSPAKHEFQALDPEKEVSLLYSVNAIFVKEELLFLEKIKENKETPLELADCFDYLRNLEIEAFKDDHLVLKELYLEREHSGQEFKKCLVAFTIDNNFLIFDDFSDKKTWIPTFCFRMEYIRVIPNQQERIAEITAKVTGILFDSKNRFLFRFENNDQVEEFANYFNFINLKKGGRS